MTNKQESREQQSTTSAIAITYVRQFLAGAAQLGLILISARTLGATQTGNLALALVFPKVLAAFLNLGMGSANVYFIASRQVTPETAWAYARNLTTIMSLLGLCLGVALLHKSWPERTSPFPGRTYPTGSVTGMPRAV